MRVVHTIAELRALLHPARAGLKRIALVPTMGALHAGHVALMQQARAECDVVVVSLFVNPTQFGDPADLAAYPRQDERDQAVARDAAVDFLFAPAANEMYDAVFNTVIQVGDVTQPLEGAHRGVSHFHGVATVVAKLFNIVQPTAAYFGQKDAQQTVVIRKLVRDLNWPIQIVLCATVREPDGLALSSRNVRLGPEPRARATALYEALQIVAAAQLRAPSMLAGDLLAAGREHLALRGVGDDDIEYFSAVNPESLQEVTTITAPTLFAIAAHIGGVRLIDNIIVPVRT